MEIKIQSKCILAYFALDYGNIIIVTEKFVYWKKMRQFHYFHGFPNIVCGRDSHLPSNGITIKYVILTTVNIYGFTSGISPIGLCTSIMSVPWYFYYCM